MARLPFRQNPVLLDMIVAQISVGLSKPMDRNVALYQ